MSSVPASDGTYSRFKGWKEAEFGMYKRHWAAYFDAEVRACLELMGRRSDQALNLLEIGFGNGAFMGWARDSGHSVCGVEIEEPQIEAARRAGFRVAGSVEELARDGALERFDGAVAFDVFEHFTTKELIDFLARLRTVLVPEGWILARFPNGDSPFGRLNQHGDISHVSTYGSMAVRQMAFRSGFRAASIRSELIPWNVTSRWGIANGLRLAMRFGLELPIQVLLNVYYPGVLRWYPLTPNLVATLTKGTAT